MPCLNGQMDRRALLSVQNVDICIMNLSKVISKVNKTILEGPVKCSVP
jgi:hypothetical protein